MSRADTLAATRYFAKGTHRSDSILGNPGTEFLYAGGGLVRRLAGRLRTRTSTPACATRTSRRSWSAERSTSRRRQSTRPGSCCRISRTATRSCSPSSVTRPRSGRTSRKASKRLLEHVPRQREGRHVALHAGEGRLHARGHPHRARQGLRSHDDRPARHRAPLAAPDVAPLAEARPNRPQVERPAPVRVHRSSSVSAAGSPVSSSRSWRSRRCRSTTRSSRSSRSACRSASGIYLAWVDRDRAARTIGLSMAMVGALVRRLARVPRSLRASRGHHDDRRGCPRREPDVARPRHRPRSAHGRDRRVGEGSPSGRPGLILGAIGRRDLNSRPPVPPSGGGHCRGGARWLGSAVSAPAAAWFSGRPRQRLGTGWAQIQRPALPGESR